jgi:hypothetical protein
MEMARKIELEIVESGIRAVAELLEEEAPKTCEAMWKALETPLETLALHAIWLGRTIEVGVPEANRNFDPEQIPMENATITPSPGDLLWKHFQAGAIRGLESPLWDIMIAYGPEATMRTPAGPQPSNVWAELVGDSQAFCEECAKMWLGKARTVRIQRLV